MEEIEFNNLECILDHDNRVVKVLIKKTLNRDNSIKIDGDYIPLEFKNLTDSDKKNMKIEGDYLVIPWVLFEKVENISDIKFKEVNGVQIDPCTNKEFEKNKDGKYIVPETNPILYVDEVTFLPISYLKKHKSKFMKYAKGVGIGVGLVGLVALNIIPGVGEVADVAVASELTGTVAVGAETAAATTAVTSEVAVAGETAVVSEAATSTEVVAAEGTSATTVVEKGKTHMNTLKKHISNIKSKIENSAHKGIKIIKNGRDTILNTTDKIQKHINNASETLSKTSVEIEATKDAVNNIKNTFVGKNNENNVLENDENNVVINSNNKNNTVGENNAIITEQTVTTGAGKYDTINHEKIISNYKLVIVILIILIIIVIYLIYIACKHKSADGSIFSII